MTVEKKGLDYEGQGRNTGLPPLTNLLGLPKGLQPGATEITRTDPRLNPVKNLKPNNLAELNLLLQDITNQEQIQEIDLSDITESVTDDVLRNIALKCHKLTSLNLAGHSAITDEGLKAIADANPEIKHLDVTDCNNLTGISRLSFLPVTTIIGLPAPAAPEGAGAFAAAGTSSGPVVYASSRSLVPAETMDSSLPPFRPMKSFKPLSLIELTRSLASVSDIQMLDLSAIGADLDAILLPEIIAKNPALSQLNMSGCSGFTDDVLAIISLATKKLTHVNLNGCDKVTDAGVRALAITQVQLEYLNIIGCSGVTDEGKKQLRQYLPYANISGEGIPPKFPTMVPSYLFSMFMPYLTIPDRVKLSLTCKDNKLEVDNRWDSLTAFKPKDLAELNFGLGKITNQSQMQEIDLSSLGWKLTDIEMFYVAKKCHNLTSLNLLNCTNITDAGLLAILATNTRITHLDLRACLRITDVSLIGGAIFNSGITKLNLSYAAGITDKGLIAIANANHGITDLGLGGCPSITDEGLRAIAATNIGITRLRLDIVTRHITDEGLRAIAATNHRITDLSICINTANYGRRVIGRMDIFPGFNIFFSIGLLDPIITDAGLRAIAATNNEITDLTLFNCGKITDDGVAAIATANPGIKKLDLTYCRNLTSRLRILFSADTNIIGLPEVKIVWLRGIAPLATPAPANAGASTHRGELEDSLTSFKPKDLAELNLFLEKNTDSDKIRKLDLSDVGENLTDEMLVNVALKFHTLTILNLSGCKGVTNAGMEVITAANPGITKLDLSECIQITDSGLEAVARTNKSIIKLALFACDNITDTGLAAIAATNTGITDLDISYTKITDTGLAAVAISNNGITQLDLSECMQITDTGLAAIAATNPRINHLSLFGCTQITDTGLEAVARTNKSITNLNLFMCSKITHDGLKAIAIANRMIKFLNVEHCNNLTSMSRSLFSPGTDIIGLPLAAAPARASVRAHKEKPGHSLTYLKPGNSSELYLVLEEITGPNQIRELDLSAIAENLTNLMLYNISLKCRNLTSLNLANCIKIDHRALIAIANANHGITNLNLSRCINTNDTGLRLIADNNHGITNLDLSYCSEITDDSLRAIAATNHGITHLNLRGCIKISDDSLRAIAAANHGITHLNLSHSTKITDEGLRAITAANPGITDLDLGYTKITDDSLRIIADANHGIAHLNLFACREITDDGIRAIIATNPGILSLDVRRCNKLNSGLRSFFSPDTNIIGLPSATAEPEASASAGAGAGTHIGELGHSSTCFKPTSLSEFVPFMQNRDYQSQILELDLSDIGKRLKTNIFDDARMNIRLSDIVKKCKNLTSINLAHCVEITDESLIAIAATNHGITHLNLYGCKKITDAGLIQIAHTNHGITHLNLHGCKKITYESLEAIAATNHGITHLNLSACREITDEGIRAIIATNPGILSLDVRRCNKLNGRLRSFFSPGTNVIGLPSAKAELEAPASAASAGAATRGGSSDEESWLQKVLASEQARKK